MFYVSRRWGFRIGIFLYYQCTVHSFISSFQVGGGVARGTGGICPGVRGFVRICPSLTDGVDATCAAKNSVAQSVSTAGILDCEPGNLVGDNVASVYTADIGTGLF